MTIEITEKPNEAQVKEAYEISIQRNRIYASPNMKLKNQDKQAILNILYGVALLVITGLLGVYMGFDTMTTIAFTLSGVVLIFAILWLVLYKKSFSKFREAYLAMEKSSLTYDEDGVEVGMNGTSTVRIPWKKVKFIRTFDEFFVVFEDTTINALLIPVKYKDQIVNYMKEQELNITMY